MRSSLRIKAIVRVFEVIVCLAISFMLFLAPSPAVGENLAKHFSECTSIPISDGKLVSETQYFRTFALRSKGNSGDLYRYRIVNSSNRCVFEFLSSGASFGEGPRVSPPDIWNHAEVTAPMPLVEVGLQQEATLLQNLEITRRFITPVLSRSIKNGCSGPSCYFAMEDWTRKNSFRLTFKVASEEGVAFLQVFYVSGEIHLVEKSIKENN